MASCSDMPAIQIKQLLKFWLTLVTGCAIVLSVIARGKISSCFVKQKCISVTVYCLLWLALSWIAIILIGFYHILMVNVENVMMREIGMIYKAFTPQRNPSVYELHKSRLNQMCVCANWTFPCHLFNGLLYIVDLSK